jgi:hypothetical protein
LKQQTIYEVAVIPIGSLNTIRQKETVFTYFSNLKKCIESILATLALNGWECKLNYTAVYRSIKEKGKFSQEFSFAGIKVFKIVILPRIINPSLSMLGVEEKPN